MSKLSPDQEPEIRLLPEVIQNKIAAGEVVERPASVVKELVENALDAGAGRVDVEIEEGGMRLLRVSDDGLGMGERNLALCIERHATSKIRDVDDIFRIRTMGFRGEALPSIGAVSRLSITTALAGQENGYQLRLSGGNKEPIAPAAPRQGTVVEVRDLFFNTPARRKFMKGIAAEVAAINETVTRIALANPTIAFRVESGGKPQLDLPAHPDLASRIRSLFGKDLRLLPVERVSGDNNELQVRGFVARPPESRANSRFIYTFLNNRWIRHPGLTRGICDAYQGSLPPRRYPFAVLMLEIDPAQVDVNAHPTKEVVRFENDGLIVGATHKAVRDALRGASFLNEVERARQEQAGQSAQRLQELRQNTAEATADYVRSQTVPSARSTSTDAATATNVPGATGASGPTGSGQPLRPPSASTEAMAAKRPSAFAADAAFAVASVARNADAPAPNQAGAEDHGAEPAQESAASLSRPIARECAATAEHHAQTAATTGAAPSEQKNEQQTRLLDAVSALQLVGQAGGKYLVVERPDGLLLVDQHAMHERWNYDRLREKDRPVVSQRLLIPVRITLTPAEKGLAQEAFTPLTEAGFELDLEEEGSEQTLVVKAHPELIPARRIEQAVRDVLADLEHTPLERFRDELLASLACHSAVLFGTRLSPEACVALLDKYRDGGLPTCPHGRPTGIFFSWADLASRFGR